MTEKRRPYPPEWRRKNAEVRERNRLDPNVREKQRMSWLGRPRSMETREKIGASRRKSPRALASYALLRGRHVSSETREKIRLAKLADPQNRTRLVQLNLSRTGVPLSAGHREKLRLWRTAYSATPEGREKMLGMRRASSRTGRTGSRPERSLVPFIENVLGGRWNGTGRAGVWVDRYLPDFVWPDRKIAVEVDGYWHSVRPEKDAERDRVFADLGWRVLRVGADDVMRARPLVEERIRAFLYDP